MLSNQHTPRPEFMRAAIEAAKSSPSPFAIHRIGAAVVKDGNVVSAEPNQTKQAGDSTMHAEIAAIRKACEILGERKLNDCVLYSTHEPCAMCAGALVWCRLDGVVFGATLSDMQAATDAEGNRIWADPSINVTAREILERSVPVLEIAEGYMRKECKELFDA